MSAVRSGPMARPKHSWRQADNEPLAYGLRSTSAPTILSGREWEAGEDMDVIVGSAIAAMATAVGTDAWQPLRGALLALWRRVRPSDAPRIEQELDALPTHLVEIRRAAGDEQDVLEPWRAQLRELLTEHPELADALEQIARTARDDRPGARSSVMLGIANDHGSVTQIGGNQINYGA